MKNVYIIHGWSGSPQEPIHQWLKQELEARNCTVHALEMPHPEKPTIEEWVSFLQEKCPAPNENTFFVGHSIGCQTILRYLAQLPKKVKVGGVVLLAPWVHLLETAYENPAEEEKIAQPWLTTPIDWETVKKHCDTFVGILLDNDFCVPMSDKDIFKALLDAKIIVEHNKGHFTMENEIDKVPVVLHELLEMTR